MGPGSQFSFLEGPGHGFKCGEVTSCPPGTLAGRPYSRSLGVLMRCLDLCSWFPTVAAEAVPYRNEIRKAQNRVWPCRPGKEGYPVDLEPLSSLGRKETVRRMSGSGCWRVRGRASPSPIGKYHALGLRCGGCVGMAISAVCGKPV